MKQMSRKPKQSPEVRARRIALLEQHVIAAAKHMDIAHKIAREQRVLTGVMYVNHPAHWYPQDIEHYMSQVKTNLQYVKRGTSVRAEMKKDRDGLKNMRKAMGMNGEKP